MGMFSKRLEDLTEVIAKLHTFKNASEMGDTFITRFDNMTGLNDKKTIVSRKGWVIDEGDGNRYVDVSLTAWGVRIKVEGVSGPIDVGDLVTWISRYGIGDESTNARPFKRDGDAVKSNYQPSMTWTWNEGEVTLEAVWSGPEAKCRIVTTGSRYVEGHYEDITEMVCDEDVESDT